MKVKVSLNDMSDSVGIGAFSASLELRVRERARRCSLFEGFS
jgi:hypothetical protein